MTSHRIAVVTGASSGIGAATARELARLGFELIVTGRRKERLTPLVEEFGATAYSFDIRDWAAISSFATSLAQTPGRVDVLVNNAGLALGRVPLAETADDDWVQMLDTNVLGVARMTRALLPLLRVPPHAHIINIGSTAGFEAYAGGGGYTASKHALRAISQTVRVELNGEPIRVSEIAPGMVETEFSLVRNRGDADAAKSVYAGVTPLAAQDIADCVGFVASRPPHVDIDYIVVRPIAQANSHTIARK